MARKGGKDRGLKPVIMANGKIWWKARAYRGDQEWLSKAFPTKQEARDVYNKIKTQLREGTHFPARSFSRSATRVRINQLLELVVADYRRNKRKSLETALMHQRFWKKFAGETAAVTVTGNQLETWADQWIADGCSSSTVNRRMDKLLRGYHLAIEGDPPLLAAAPKWKPLDEPPARSGFMEWPVFTMVRSSLPEYARIPISIAFWLGIRWGENKALRLPQVTFDHHKRTVTILLSGHQTKTKRPRMIIMAGDLYTVLSDWAEKTKQRYPWCQYLSHRNGKPIGTLDTVFKSVCVRLGLGTGTWVKGKGYWKDYDGPIVHDFRRTGARNLRRAGVDRDVCKRITGHSTDSCFTRYNIVNEEDLEQAGLRVSQFLQPKLSHGEPDEKPESSEMSVLPAS